MSKFNIVKQSYQLATFSAYDFATVKRALVDNIKREFPETFNDFTEFSELIMIINSFAYISELFAYRLDINAQENFIQLASIKENVIRLAQWIGYNPKRCIPARGLFKLQSLTPSFDVIDNRGENLRNKTIRWNDPNNVFWKSQFLTIIQTSINEELQNPLESNRVQINNTLIEKYSFENLQSKFGTLSFKSLDGTNFNVLSSTIDEKGFVENNPRSTNKTSLFFLDDSTSDSSPTTGFFLDAVQGDIQSIPVLFENVVPNRTHAINVPNINEFDVWLYEVDTNQFWYNSSKLYFIDKPSTKLFKVNTINDNTIDLEFGDGVISEIPVGNFLVFFRTSINDNILIDKNSLSNLSINIPLFINNNKTNLNASISCETDLYAIGSEDMQHIKRVASSLYQTQDRLVTEYDFKHFLQQDPRILCANPQNIKSIGETSYFKWMQQSNSNFNLLFDDLYIFNDVEISVDSYNDISIQDVIERIEQLLAQNTLMQTQSSLFMINPTRSLFNRQVGSEFDTLQTLLGSSNNTLTNFPLCLSKSTTNDIWEFTITSRQQNNPVWNFNNIIIVDKISTNTNTVWKIYSKHTNIVVGKNNTQFIHNDFLTQQKFTIHPYNLNMNNIPLSNTITLETVSSVIHNGLIVKNALRAYSKDTDNNGIPNILNLHDELNFSLKHYICSTYIESGNYYIDIPFENLPVIPYTNDVTKVTDTSNNNVVYEYGTNNYEPTRKIKVLTTDTSVNVFVKQYIFIKTSSTYEIINKSYDIFNKIIAVNDKHPEYKRCIGKGNVIGKYNFNIPFYQVLNPEHTNLITIDIITKQMIESFKKYLSYDVPYVPENSFDLTNKFTYLIQKSMFTDVVSLSPGKISAFIGSKSDISRRYVINIRKNPNGYMLPIDIKNAVIQILTEAFESDFVMGEIIYAAQIIGIIMYKLSQEVLDINILSTNPLTFGQEIDTIVGDSNELLYPHITYNDINIS